MAHIYTSNLSCVVNPLTNDTHQMGNVSAKGCHTWFIEGSIQVPRLISAQRVAKASDIR